MSIYKVYFRKVVDNKLQLGQIDVSGTVDYETTRSSVVSQLRMDMEVWAKPMFVLIQGGKA